jgi:hypothetical protein
MVRRRVPKAFGFWLAKRARSIWEITNARSDSSRCKGILKGRRVLGLGIEVGVPGGDAV